MTIHKLLYVIAIVSSARETKNDDSKIVGGFKTDLKYMPFATSLQYNGQHFCGGALISLGHVLSACHCLSLVQMGMRHNEIPHWNPENLSAVVGTEDLKAEDAEYKQRRAIEQIIIHPMCSYIKTIFYDFAMAYLKSPLQRSVKVMPFNMFAYNKIDYENKIKWLAKNEKFFCYVVGWGTADPNSTTASPVLKAARMQVIPDQECRVLLGRVNYKYAFHDFDESGTMCTLPFRYRSNESDCAGDSGGPFFCGSTVYGIVSYGFRCGQFDVPNVYAKVSYAVDWLLSLGVFPEDALRRDRNTQSRQNRLETELSSEVARALLATLVMVSMND